MNFRFLNFYAGFLILTGTILTYGAVDKVCAPSNVEGSQICVGDSVIYRENLNTSLRRAGHAPIADRYGLVMEKVIHISSNNDVEIDDGFRTDSKSVVPSLALIKFTNECYEGICSGQIVMSAFSPWGVLYDNVKQERVKFKTQIYGLTADRHFIIHQDDYNYYVTPEEVKYGQGDPMTDQY
jgi:hypothetical protein